VEGGVFREIVWEGLFLENKKASLRHGESVEEVEQEGELVMLGTPAMAIAGFVEEVAEFLFRH
jgi:hypothetical protein